MRAWLRRVGAMVGLAAGLSIMVVAAAPAEARGFVGFTFGVPLVGGPPVYYVPPPPPPAYFYYLPPPPAYYVPPPPAFAPPATAGPSSQPQQPCQEYHTTATIDGTPQPAYGWACLQPDGTWRIVQ